jgi:hypothetical protein
MQFSSPCLSKGTEVYAAAHHATDIEKIRLGQYDMTVHAMEEMAEDNLDIIDVEHTILGGQIARSEKGDPRGTKYVIQGKAVDNQTQVGVVGRFY